MNCPKCGDSLGPLLASTRMTNCPSCGTSVFLRDGRFDLAGEQGVLHDAPQLLRLGDRIKIFDASWRLIGQARFSYGRGTWDEFWATDDAGSTAWISVDEGDVVVQFALHEDAQPNLVDPPVLGALLRCNGQEYRVTEAETARCEAFRGTLPELFTPGQTYRFVNCTGAGGRLLSGEYWDGGRGWYEGLWVDPFDVLVEDRA